MKYFTNVNTLEQLRRQYKELLKKYHPDNANGSTAATQVSMLSMISCSRC